MSIEEMRKKRAELWDKAREFLDSKQDANGNMSDEDTKTYEAMEQELVNLGNAIKRQEKLEAINAELNRPTTQPITTKPSAHTDSKSGTATDDYKVAFWNKFRKKGYYDVQNVLEIGTDANGGYLVPDEFERTLIQALEDENFFRGLATQIKTDSGERQIPIVASHGTAQWIDENGSYNFSDDAFTQETLSAYKLGTAIKVSEELLNDSVFNLQAYISGEFSRRIGSAEEQAFLTGDGTKKPTGVLTTAPLGYTTTKADISFDDVQELYYSLKAPYRKDASFIMHDSTVKILRKLKDSNGNYLWQPSISADIPDTIMNRPFYTSPYIPEIGAGKKVLLFGNYKYYWIAERKGKSFKRLDELFAMNGQIGFLASERIDGKLILPEAVKVLQMKSA